MFAGVASILLNEDNTEVLGISSREGEEVRKKYIIVVFYFYCNTLLKLSYLTNKERPKTARYYIIFLTKLGSILGHLQDSCVHHRTPKDQ